MKGLFTWFFYYNFCKPCPHGPLCLYRSIVLFEQVCGYAYWLQWRVLCIQHTNTFCKILYNMCSTNCSLGKTYIIVWYLQNIWCSFIFLRPVPDLYFMQCTHVSYAYVCFCRDFQCASNLRASLCRLRSLLSPVKESPVPAQTSPVMRSHHLLYLLPAPALLVQPEGPPPPIRKTFLHSASTSCHVTLPSGTCRRCLSSSALCRVSDL